MPCQLVTVLNSFGPVKRSSVVSFFFPDTIVRCLVEVAVGARLRAVPRRGRVLTPGLKAVVGVVVTERRRRPKKARILAADGGGGWGGRNKPMPTTEGDF